MNEMKPFSGWYW